MSMRQSLYAVCMPSTTIKDLEQIR